MKPAGTGQLNVQFQRIDQAIAMAAMYMATNVSVQAIVALTESGSTAQWLSRVRSGVPIFALSPLRDSLRRMAFTVVCIRLHITFPAPMLKLSLFEGVRLLLQQGHIKVGDRIILTMGQTYTQ